MDFATRTTGPEEFRSTYGDASASILGNLSFIYSYRHGIEGQDWNTATYPCGLVIALPACLDGTSQAILTKTDAVEAFAVAAARTYEAYAIEASSDDEEVSLMLSGLLGSAEAAQRLVSKIREASSN